MHKKAKEDLIYKLSSLRNEYLRYMILIDKSIKKDTYPTKDIESLRTSMDVQYECAKELDKLISLYESKE